MGEFGVGHEELGPDNGDTPLMRSLYFGVFLILEVISSYYAITFCGDTPQNAK